MQKWTTRFFEEVGLMSNYVILENLADERGEPAAKVARTLVRLGCDLYLRFGPSREPYIGENFFPEHPTVEMKYKIDPGDYTLTKESQEVVIKRLGRGDFTTLGLLVWIYTKVDSSITVPYQIELMAKDESVCVVVDPDDVEKLPPPSTYQTAPGSMYPAPPGKKIFEKFEKIKIPNKRKPHSAFVVVAKTMMKIKRGEAWKELVDLAQKSKGQTEVTLPGWGKIYLRRVRLNPEQEILYSHEQFDYDKTENLPDGVKKFTIEQFQTSWTDFKKKSHEGSMKEV